MTLTATYWLLYGFFEIIPEDIDFEIIREPFDKILTIVNSEEQ